MYDRAPHQHDLFAEFKAFGPSLFRGRYDAYRERTAQSRRIIHEEALYGRQHVHTRSRRLVFRGITLPVPSFVPIRIFETSGISKLALLKSDFDLTCIVQNFAAYSHSMLIVLCVMWLCINVRRRDHAVHLKA